MRISIFDGCESVGLFPTHNGPSHPECDGLQSESNRTFSFTDASGARCYSVGESYLVVTYTCVGDRATETQARQSLKVIETANVDGLSLH